MSVYDADTLPVDDDEFLNGGLPTLDSAPAPSPMPTPTAAPKPPVDEFSANAIDPMASPAPAPVATPTPTPEPEPETIPAPTPAPESVLEPEPEPIKPVEIPKPEPKPESAPAPAPTPVPASTPVAEETKEVSLQPSASFEAEMQKKTELEAQNEEDRDKIGGSSYGTPSIRPKNPYDEIGHISGMTPSQAMIPDGMLAENRVKLDDEEDDAPRADAMIPSQAMAETFSNAGPLKIPALEEKPEEVEEDIVDDEPVVVGPVISSAGMESLTEEQAENPTATVQAEKMTMEAKVDNDTIEKSSDEVKSEVDESKPELEPETKDTPTAPEQGTNPESKAAESETESESKPELEEKHEEEVKHEPVFFQTTEPAISMASNTSTNQVAPHAKNTHPALFIIIGVVVLAVVGFIIVLVIMAMNNGGILGLGGDDEIDSEKLRKVFFIQDADGEYVLFDRNGSRLIDFSINPESYSAPDFKKQPAMKVSKGEGADLQYGIIDRDGKMIAEFGKYEEIEPVGSAFYAKNDEGEFMISGAGKITGPIKIMSYTSNYVDGYYLASASSDGHNGGFVALEDGKINIYNNYLRKIHSFDCAVEKARCGSEDVYISQADGALKDEKDALVVYYNGVNYALDAKSGKELAKLEEAAYYELQIADQDKNAYYFYSRDIEDSSDYKFKAVVDGKVYLPPSDCKLTSAIKLNDEVVVGCSEDGYKAYFLSTDLKAKGLDISDHYMFYNSNTYVSDEKGLKFFRNGKKVKEISGNFDAYSTTTDGEYYLIREKCSSSSKCNGIDNSYAFTYYNLDGGKLFDDYFYSAHMFEKISGTAVVSKDRNSSYVIDKQGNKISDSYNGYISEECEDEKAGIVYYSSEDYTNSKYALFNSKGEVISKKQTSSRMFCEDGDIYYSDYSSKTVYKNGDDNEIMKVSGSNTGVDIMDDGYIVSYDYKNYTSIYYTLSGKKFFEVDLKSSTKYKN